MVQGDAIVYFLVYPPTDPSKHLRYLRSSNDVKERTTYKICSITHVWFKTDLSYELQQKFTTVNKE